MASNATVNSVLPWSIPAGVNTVVVNGYPMAYQDTGIGEPVVLVHGALLDYRFWCAQVPEFSRRYRVISLSLRHYYPEAWDGKGGGFSILEHADDVAELINVLELGRVHLLGQSRGGAVAVNVAKRHPELIKTLTLADASGLEALLPDTPESAKLAAQVKQLASNLRKRIAAGQIAEGAEEFIDALSGPGAWAKVPRERQQIFLDNVGTAAVDTGERPRITCADIVKFDFPILLVNGGQWRAQPQTVRRNVCGDAHLQADDSESGHHSKRCPRNECREPRCVQRSRTGVSRPQLGRASHGGRVLAHGIAAVLENSRSTIGRSRPVAAASSSDRETNVSYAAAD